MVARLAELRLDPQRASQGLVRQDEPGLQPEGLASAGLAPWLAPVVFLVLLLRSGWGLSRWRRPVRPQVLGFQELGYGLLTLVLLVIGYRLGP